jgi:hypothetical protein
MTYIPEALRRTVIDRANRCCKYCLIPQESKLFTFEVDHIIAEKHRGATREDNLCLSCLDCNRYKGSDFASFDPNTGEIALLFNPRRDQWTDHLRLDGAVIQPLTPVGRVTVFLLQINDPTRVAERAALIEAERYPPPEHLVWRTESTKHRGDE